MRKKRVLVAHNNIEFIELLRQCFLENDLYTLSDIALNGQELLNKVSLDNYDIVICKNALTQVTGLYALEGLFSKTKNKPEIIILITPFINDFIRNKCQKLNIDYIQGLDVNISEIHQLLCHLGIKKTVEGKKYFESQIEVINILKKIGLLKTYIGYAYFEYVLNIMLEKSENINKYMKTIYHMVGQHFNVSATSVEKAMRTCIKSSLSKSDGFYAKMLFGYYEDKYPSTSIFLQVCIKTLKEQKNMIISNNIGRSTRKI
ncbi:hypothetical protein KHQ81_14905 [Mycoplasmatota bacterium]|nr:hypothetical protein KHQ81_14905 [Mycoplasmatota bacterium]